MCGLPPEEQRLRALHIFRCAVCFRRDLVVKGAQIADTKLRCGTCGLGVYTLNAESEKYRCGRGCCSQCHSGRECPTCSGYCLQRQPVWCRQCATEVPSVSRIALWCSDCYTAEELQLRLCRACHPRTQDLPDKALPSYEEACAHNFDLLSRLPSITGDEPALLLSPLLGA